jgi:hypothetical protein
MRVFWSNDAADRLDELGALSLELPNAVESEIAVMFADAVPSSARLASPAGALLVALPCGVEAVFERTGDGVVLLSLN